MRNRTAFPLRPPAGFTLVEMIVVIVLTGIIAGMIAVFIRSPVEAYVDTARRARLTEAADTALRRFARDLRTALPNSVRVTVLPGGQHWLEFIPTTGGGRYRQYPSAAGAGDILDFSTADTSFQVLGPVPQYGAGDSMVVFNLEPGSVSDAYAGNNRAALGGANINAALVNGNITLAGAGMLFPAPSPGARFHVVQTPVSYACPVGGAMQRFTGYAFSPGQLTPPPGAANAILVSNVVGCTIAYNASAVKTRTGLVTIWLSLADPAVPGEVVQVVHQIHVQNQP